MVPRNRNSFPKTADEVYGDMHEIFWYPKQFLDQTCKPKRVTDTLKELEKPKKAVSKRANRDGADGEHAATQETSPFKLVNSPRTTIENDLV